MVKEIVLFTSKNQTESIFNFNDDNDDNTRQGLIIVCDGIYSVADKNFLKNIKSLQGLYT